MPRNVVGLPEPVPSPELAASSPDDAAVAAAVELWKQAGAEHWLPIAGRSMRPLLRQGDTVLVAYGADGIRRGDVVVFWRDGGLVAHRVLRTAGKSHEDILITKGDRLRRLDAPVSAGQVVGRVVSVNRSGRHIRLDAPGWRAAGWLVAVGTLVLAGFYDHIWLFKRGAGPAQRRNREECEDGQP